MDLTVASCPVPELPEVEAYRRLAVEALDRPIASVSLYDPRFLRGATSLRQLKRILVGASFRAARRIGKLLVLDLAGTPAATDHRLGLRFGMTGSLFVDSHSAVDELIYSSKARGAQWDRFAVGLADGGDLVVHDPRILGGVILDPDETALGPDEVLVEIRVPPTTGGFGFEKFNRRAQDWAIVGVVVAHTEAGPGVALVNMATTPIRAAGTEEALRAGASAADAAARADEGTAPPEDQNASREYRRHLAQVLTRRALESAGR